MWLFLLLLGGGGYLAYQRYHHGSHSPSKPVTAPMGTVTLTPDQIHEFGAIAAKQSAESGLATTSNSGLFSTLATLADVRAVILSAISQGGHAESLNTNFQHEIERRGS